MLRTREGYSWTPTSGLQAGLPCEGVVQPARSISECQQNFDVIVVGAGYTGLTAARDLTLSGLNVLLIEGRDRIGGRTWSANVDGYPFEMGGTWVHWHQPHVYRELSRYGMADQLVHSPDYSAGVNRFSLVTPSGRRDMSHEEEGELFARAMGKFMDIDGNRGKSVMPFPFTYKSHDVSAFAEISLADRIEQIKNELSEEEQYVIEALVLVCSGGTRDDSSFLDFLRWWAAGNYNIETLMDTLIVFKIMSGQSAFARRFFDEAKGTGRLSYSFDTRVDSIRTLSGGVCVITGYDEQYIAKRVICTVPLNVLKAVHFDPPLDPLKTEASEMQHVNQIVKLHAEIKDPAMRSWSGITYPHNKLLLGSADGMTTSGNTHIVFFGCHQNHMQVEEDVDEALSAIQEFTSMEVERLIFHNWSKDEFSKGAWVWYRPGMEVKYLDALRRRQGPVLFANSDWAVGGWRSFIDGAIQSGTEAAYELLKELPGSLS